MGTQPKAFPLIRALMDAARLIATQERSIFVKSFDRDVHLRI